MQASSGFRIATSSSAPCARPEPSVYCSARRVLTAHRKAPAACSAPAPPSVMERNSEATFLTTTKSKPLPRSPSTTADIMQPPPPASAPFPTPSVSMEAPELSPANFEEYLSGEGLVLVDFYTDYCGPCKLMLPHFEKLQVAFRKIKFVKYNCGLEGHDALATRQRIRSLPTFRLYRKGRAVEEVTGARVVQLRQMLSHHYR